MFARFQILNSQDVTTACFAILTEFILLKNVLVFCNVSVPRDLNWSVFIITFLQHSVVELIVICSLSFREKRSIREIQKNNVLVKKAMQYLVSFFISANQSKPYKRR